MLFPIFVKSGASAGWVRPADWPAMPASNSNEIDILTAVWNNGSNYCALSCTVSSGTYTVDWGDGTAPQTYTSGTRASYQYSYSASGLGALTAEGYKTAMVKVTPTTGGATITAFDTGQKNSALTQVSSNPWLDMQVNAPACTSMAVSSSGTNCEYLQRCNVIAIGSVTSTLCTSECIVSSGRTFRIASTTAVHFRVYRFHPVLLRR